MTIEQTRAIMEPYAASHDPKYIAENGVFIDMSSGERHQGREAIGGMLDYVYHQAFDAHPEDVKMAIGEGAATLEATFTGRHIGEFAGLPATGRRVRVPLCVSYDVGEDGIREARIYMMANVMIEQLGEMPEVQV